MSSSNYSLSCSKFVFVNVKCRCNKHAKILVADTAENSKKRFYRCDKCRFFKWWWEVEHNMHLLRPDLYGEEVNQADVNHGYNSLKEEIKELKEALNETRTIVLKEATDLRSELFKLVILAYVVIGAVVVLFLKET